MPRSASRISASLLVALALAPLSGHLFAEPTPAATRAFDAYAASVEAGLTRQHQSPSGFLVSQHPTPDHPIIENLTPANLDLPGAMLHHWRGTAFAPGVTADQFDHLLRNLPAYPQYFAPEVVRAQLLHPSANPAGHPMEALLRIRQHHILTVVLDTTYAITFGSFDPHHRFSLSRSTHIAEIASPGAPSEHALPPADGHGFLWRLNTYWSYEERPEGLYLQIETISLTRSIPPGLGWAVRPFVQSIPRESLEFTLHSACQALRK
jgi:hypothetical protein